ncbi:SusC/RagA family TonB-linked outer membrane protein [Gelidibacter salicanalis]|uniref:TonB-dependent receptor n=1 Tax=Gelidibacter salicanalis TaxID=291193 RepID=A0A934NC09_9FLAO|nr:TonB-dependent receptor [Gelidibacter salicanalis]MBJ7880215.1 TonB-dependent receptor [Gelidibacter salicanalis]
MKLKLTWLMTLFMAFVMQISLAQEKTVSGTVTSISDGLPLPGVNVIVKGTTRGVQTDFDGNYSINVSVGETLSFSFVSMSKKEIVVGASNIINVALEEDVAALDEVIVVAYGTQTAKSLVGSVTSLSAETIEKQQVTTVTSAIQGTVAGVNVITSGGQPGENPTIRIRGIGSINASAGPLIVLDGVPFNGNINSISGDQIESMNVLKDASSTALYGSRAANGVILITTKKGALNSKPTLQLTAVTGFSEPAVDLHKTIGTNDFMRYSWEAERNNQLYVGNLTPAAAAAAASQNLIPTLGYNPYGTLAQPVDANGNLLPGANLLWETDWKDAILRKAALRSEYSLSLSGGGTNTRYFLSANYLNQEGSVKESDFERITTRLNLESSINEWLTVGLNSSLSNSKQNFPEQSGNTYQSSIQWIYSMSSVYPLYRRNTNGGLILDDFGNTIYDYGSTPEQAQNGTRPLFGNENAAGSLYNYETLNNRTAVTANGFANIDFTDDLSFRSTVSYENYLFDGYEYNAYNIGSASSVGGRVSQDRDITTTLNFTNAFNYDKTFGDHAINATGIFETYQFKIDAMGAQGTGFLPGVGVLNGSTTPEEVSGYINEERLTSYLGRLGYNFKEKYYVEGSFRRDGSSRFAKESRWGNFYSVGGTWIASSESFLENSTWLDFLKFRVSYGELGNNKTLNDDNDDVYFPYLQLFETGWNELGNTGVLLGGVTDPNLSWETSALFNVGMDFTLFNNTIEGSVEYYNKESVDLIYQKPLPISTGNDGITTNVGSISNKGVEVALLGRIIKGNNISWSAGLNFAFTTNEITELTQESFIKGTKRWEVGRSLYDFYIREWAGVDPVDGYGMWYKDVLDTDGEPTGERETTKSYADAERYYQGSSLPDVTGGFNTDLKVGNFDFNMLFNFSLGSQIYDSSYAGLMDGFSNPGYQASPDISRRWQQPGDVTDIPLLLNSQNDFNGTSTRFLFDNDYLRMRAITLGYTLPSNATKSLFIEKVRIYLRGDNLLTWSSHKGLDPEQNVAGTTDSRSSIMKTVSFGLNVKF